MLDCLRQIWSKLETVCLERRQNLAILSFVQEQSRGHPVSISCGDKAWGRSKTMREIRIGSGSVLLTLVKGILDIDDRPLASMSGLEWVNGACTIRAHNEEWPGLCCIALRDLCPGDHSGSAVRQFLTAFCFKGSWREGLLLAG